jgi:hypothetical protein
MKIRKRIPSAKNLLSPYVLRRTQAFENARKRQGKNPCGGNSNTKQQIKSNSPADLMLIFYDGLADAVQTYPLTE